MYLNKRWWFVFTERWTWSASSMRDTYHRDITVVQSVCYSAGPGILALRIRAESSRVSRRRWQKAKGKPARVPRFCTLATWPGPDGRLTELTRGDRNREIHPSSALGTADSCVQSISFFLIFSPPLNVPRWQSGHVRIHHVRVCIDVYVQMCMRIRGHS